MSNDHILISETYDYELLDFELDQEAVLPILPNTVTDDSEVDASIMKRACQKSIQDFHTSSSYIKPPSLSFAIHMGIFLQIWSNQGRYPAYDADNLGQKGQLAHL